jgi:hypothetical protein
MLERAIIISLQITAIYVLFQQGSLFGGMRIWIANLLDKHFDKIKSIYIQKPLWDCLCCMSSFWTIVLTWSFDIRLLLCVCGVNCIIYNLFFADETGIRE